MSGSNMGVEILKKMYEAQPKGPQPKTDIQQDLNSPLLESLKAFAAMEGVIPEASQPAPPAMQRNPTQYGFGDPFNEEGLLHELRGSVTEIPEKTVCPYCQGPAVLADEEGGFECQNCGRTFSMDADGAPQDVDVPTNSPVGPQSVASPNLRVPRAGGVYQGDMRAPARNYESAFYEDDDPDAEDSADGSLTEASFQDMVRMGTWIPLQRVEDQGVGVVLHFKNGKTLWLQGDDQDRAAEDAVDDEGNRVDDIRDAAYILDDYYDIAESAGTRSETDSYFRYRESCGEDEEPLEDLTKSEAKKSASKPSSPAPPSSGSKKQLDHYLYVPHHKVSATVAALNKKGVRSSVTRTTGDSHSMVVAHHNVAKAEHGDSKEFMRRVAKKVGGTYDGWGSNTRVRESSDRIPMTSGFTGEDREIFFPDRRIKSLPPGHKVVSLRGTTMGAVVGPDGSGKGFIDPTDLPSDHPHVAAVRANNPHYDWSPHNEGVSFSSLVEARLPEAWTAANSLGVLGGALGLGGVAGYFAGRKGGKDAADVELQAKSNGSKTDMSRENLPPWEDDYWHPRKRESIDFGKRILERLSKFDEDLTTANVGTGPDVALGNSNDVGFDVEIEVRKDPDKTFSIVAKYGDGTSTDLESNIQTKEEAATLLADYQEQYGSGEDYKTEQTMRQPPSTKSLIESIAARGGTLDEKSLRLYLEDEDFGKIMATPDATTKYDINPAEKPDKGEAEPWLTSSGMEPEDGGGVSQDDPQGTLPEDDPPVNSGPTRDPFAATVMGAGDNSSEDAQFMEHVRRRFSPRIKERIDSLFETDDDDDKPAFLKKKDDDSDDDDKEDKDKKDDDKEDDKDKKEALRRFQGALNETLDLLPQQFRESMSKKHYNHISHILKTSATKDELHHRLADMMAMDNPRFDKTRFHQAAGTTGYEKPPSKPKKRAAESNNFNLHSGAGLRAQMIVGLQEQKADPIYVHEAISSQFGRAFQAFEEALEPIQKATTPQTSLAPADHDSVNPGATPQEDVPANAVPEMANNANPPVKETQRPARRSSQEGRFLRARYGRGLTEEGDPIGGEPTVDSENDNPNNEELPSDSGQFYTASPEAAAATQAAQDLNAPAPEVDSLENLEGGMDDPDQVSFNMPATQESVIELVRSGMINYMSEEYQREARRLVKEGVITEADWAGTAGKVGTAALNVAKTGIDLGGRLATRAARAIPAGTRPVALAAAAGAGLGYLARRHQDQQDESAEIEDSIISEESFEDFLSPLADDDRLLKRKIESKVTESDYDKQLQQGTLVYANGVDGVPNGTEGQVTVQMPTEAGFLYLVQFLNDTDGKLVRQDQLTV